MVTVSAADLRQVEQIERELAAEGRECERLAVQTPERLAGYAFEVEHITPVARPGADTLANLALAPGPGNKAKGARQRAHDPQTGELAPQAAIRTYAPGDETRNPGMM